MTAPTDAARALVVEATAALGRLRRSWLWLAEARSPGVPGSAALIERQLSPAAEAVEAEQIRRDRRAQAGSLRVGIVPSGPRPSAVRIGPVKVRLAVAADVWRLADRLHEAGLLLVSPQAYARRTAPCAWCRGSGLAQRPEAWPWEWPRERVSCSLCGGHGRSCVTCGHTAACGCDMTDTVMAAVLDAITVALPRVTQPAQAADAVRVLERCDAGARRALGLGDDWRVIKAPCPACGRRDLHAEVSSPRRDEWSVVCRAPLCSCRGPGCGCGRGVRYRGRRHRWPAAEFGDLADRLGVDLSALGELRRAS